MPKAPRYHPTMDETSTDGQVRGEVEALLDDGADRHCARNYAPLSVTLVRGEGVYVWDDRGVRYLDMLSAYSAVSHGHSHPRLVAALTGQAQRLAIASRAFNTDRLGPFLKR